MRIICWNTIHTTKRYVTVLSMSESFARVAAANITRFRTRLGMSQRQLAEALHGIGCPKTQSWVSRAETGETPIGVGDAVSLAMALGVSVPALLTPPGGGGAETDALWNWLNSAAPLGEHTPEQAQRWREQLR